MYVICCQARQYSAYLSCLYSKAILLLIIVCYFHSFFFSLYLSFFIPPFWFSYSFLTHTLLLSLSSLPTKLYTKFIYFYDAFFHCSLLLSWWKFLCRLCNRLKSLYCVFLIFISCIFFVSLLVLFMIWHISMHLHSH